ncbi:MAG: 50S ribosomal protein L23 [Acidobacteria bacterium]|nr:50S ribosomal protein L23 [Acidobacteriota bacterium]
MAVDVFKIIRRPIVTEKALTVKETERTVVFEVAASATKTEIKEAVEKIFNAAAQPGKQAVKLGPRTTRGKDLVTVVDVRTANFHGKFRRRGMVTGYRKDWKKAYVKLATNSKMIEVAEG